MLFVKCGRLKGKGVHKRVFAAALPGLIFRSLQQPAAEPLAPERFADEQEPDAKPVAEGLCGQSGELPARLVFQKHAERHIFRCLAVPEVVVPQHLVDLMDVAFVSVICDPNMHAIVLWPHTYS